MWILTTSGFLSVVKYEHARDANALPLPPGASATDLLLVRARVAADLTDMLTAAGLDTLSSTGAYSFLVPPAWVKAKIERGRTSSDLNRNQSGLAGSLELAARAERAVLRRLSLPAGLSVVAVGRKPSFPVATGRVPEH